MTLWRRVEWWHALALVLASTALVTTASALDVRDTVAQGDRIEYFGMVVQGVLNVVAGVLSYLAWRIGGVPATAWLSAALIFLGLQDFPFLLAQFADPGHSSANHGEGAEVIAAFVLLLFFTAAQRGTRVRRIDPALIGVAGACAMAGVRAWLGATDLLPAGFTQGTAWYERTLVALVCLGVLLVILNTPAFSWHVRAALAIVVVATGFQCALDTWRTPAPEATPALVTAVGVLAMGLLLLDAGIRGLLDTLDEHQEAMEAVARRALSAETQARSGADLLHEVRSTVGGLATASELLATRSELTEDQRSRLQRAVAEQLLRVDRSLHAASDQVQEFDPVRVIDPVVDFHRGSGQELAWDPSGWPTTVRHVPDALAQVLGTLLHNAARHAPGRPVRISVTSSRQHVLVAVTQPGPGIAGEVLDRLFQRGARSTHSPGQGLGLHVARRLMTDHGGDLFLRESGDLLTTFVVALPRGQA